MRQALAIPFEVLAEDQLMATGITGSPQMTLPAGNYQIRFRRDGQDLSKDVTITAEKVTELSLP